jgi:hypothetical protein
VLGDHLIADGCSVNEKEFQVLLNNLLVRVTFSYNLTFIFVDSKYRNFLEFGKVREPSEELLQGLCHPLSADCHIRGLQPTPVTASLNEP